MTINIGRDKEKGERDREKEGGGFGWEGQRAPGLFLASCMKCETASANIYKGAPKNQHDEFNVLNNDTKNNTMFYIYATFNSQNRVFSMCLATRNLVGVAVDVGWQPAGFYFGPKPLRCKPAAAVKQSGASLSHSLVAPYGLFPHTAEWAVEVSALEIQRAAENTKASVRAEN